MAKGGKHVKKKRVAPGSRMVLVFGGVALLYFVAQLVGILTSGMTTISASQMTVDDAVTATGCFIREETVIAGATGETVEHAVHSGEKVYENARLAVEYADQAALEANREIKAISDEIALLQSALQSVGDLADTAKLDQLISIQMQTLAQQTRNGIVTDLTKDTASLRQLVLRRVAGGQDAQSLQQEIETLQQKKSALQNSVSARTNVISAPCQGYFSEMVDGYETTLTPADLENLTVSTFEDKLSQTPAVGDTALGKIIGGFEWYFATIVPSEDAEGLKVGNQYGLRFSQMSQEAKATLTAKRSDTNGDRTLLIFRSNQISSELVSMRQQVVDIIKGTYSGIKVPKSAVRTQDGVLGVYTLSGSVTRFREIKVLYESDTYFIVQQSNNVRETGLVAQDNIIIKARGLEDQKVVK